MNYIFLLPITAVIGITIVLVTVFVVVDNSPPPPPATPPPATSATTTSTTIGTSTSTSATTTPPSCPTPISILGGITDPVVLTAGGYFRYAEFRDYTNTLVVSSLSINYPIPPAPPLQVTAAVEYLGDLYYTLKDVPVLSTIATGARGLVVGGDMHGYAVKNDFIYGILDGTLLLKMNPSTGSLLSFTTLGSPLTSLSVNPTTNNAFALKQNGDLVKFSLDGSGPEIPTCITGTNYTSISFDSLGRLWAFRPGSIDRLPVEPSA